MTSLQALLRSRAAECGSEVARLIETNARLFGDDPGEQVRDAVLRRVLRIGRSLIYVNAGHNPPLLLRTAGTVERWSIGGPVLGMFPGRDFTAGTALWPGDRLVLYTDGVTEALDERAKSSVTSG